MRIRAVYNLKRIAINITFILFIGIVVDYNKNNSVILYAADKKATSNDEFILEDRKYVECIVDGIISEGDKLPNNDDLPNHSELTWDVSEGDCRIEDNRVFKTDKSAERQRITLVATLKYNDLIQEVRFENIILLDKYAGYIMAYFGGEDSTEKLHLGYSYDGLNWLPIHNGNAVLETSC